MKINSTLIIVFSIFVVGLLIYGIYFKQNENETTIVYCGPGNSIPVTIFKNPTKAFPAFTNDYDLNVKGTINLIGSLKDSVPNINGDAGYKQKVVSLREQLDQDNIRMENLLKAAFFSFNQNPCDNNLKKRYNDLIDTMAFKTLELERFKASITLPSQKGGNVENDNSHVINKDTSVISTSIDRFRENYFKFQ